jgi:DNA-binding transcriptional LysR family regulator
VPQDQIGEHVGPLVNAFAARDDGIEIAVEAVEGETVGELLEQRRADIAFGPHPGTERATIASVPFLRCRLAVVARPDHPLVSAHDIPPSELSAERWLIGPPRVDCTEGVGLFFERNQLEPAETMIFTSHAAALAAAGCRGEGIASRSCTPLSTSPPPFARAARRARDAADGELWYASTLSASAVRFRPRWRCSGFSPRRPKATRRWQPAASARPRRAPGRRSTTFPRTLAER